MEHRTHDDDAADLRTEYTSVIPPQEEYHLPMLHTSPQHPCNRCTHHRRRGCKVATRNMQQQPCSGEDTVPVQELNTHHSHHHQLCDAESIQRLEANCEHSGYLGPHCRNTSSTTGSSLNQDSRRRLRSTTTNHHQGILTSVTGHCLRQLTNLCGTYSAYQWSISCLFIHVLILSLNLSSCSAYHHRNQERNPLTQERISSTEVESSPTNNNNGNFHRVDEYLRFLYPQNDTNRMWSKLVRHSPYMNRGKKTRSGRAGTKERTSFSSTEGMKRINAEMEAASCQPRDTVLDSYEEIGIPKGYSTFIFPGCVVVKRCKHGGCCRDDEECVPVQHAREEVSMLFLINQDPIEKTIIQDTACECRPKPAFCPPPQTDCPNGKVWSYSECKCTCRYRCPKPFLQDEESCECDCLMSNRDCKNVSRGRKNRKLAPEECDCVRRGLCATPPCVNGRFSISACKCVQAWS